MPEAEPYPYVTRWLRQTMGCFETAEGSGVSYGRIDAVGLRDVGRDLSGRTELIAVEVKAGNQPLGTAAGQARG